MSRTHRFEHLPLVRKTKGAARYPQAVFLELDATKEHRINRGGHSSALDHQVSTLSSNWQKNQKEREKAGLPPVEDGIPLLVQIDPTLDLNDLRSQFGFEIVSEQDDGFVIVASADTSLSLFRAKLTDFVRAAKGSGAVAKIQELLHDVTQDERLKRLLSNTLYEELSNLDTDDPYIVDVSISCTGEYVLPKRPKKGRMKDETYQRKLEEWEQRVREIREKWDDLWTERTESVEVFVEAYKGTIRDNYEKTASTSVSIPDSIVMRLELPGRGLKDLLLNHPYIFEAIEPEEVELPQVHRRKLRELKGRIVVNPPNEYAPVVCVIDSGIQEEHLYLRPAIDIETSRNFLSDSAPTDVADYVLNGGHGTRVAGAVLYRDDVPDADFATTYDCAFWVQNARVLDKDCLLSDRTLPAALIRRVVEHYHGGIRETRIFNHSINSRVACQTKHMSAWAAEIDRLCFDFDVLIIQSAGNLEIDASAQHGGVSALLVNGHSYPDYLAENCCRISSPAQSLQAITVGSVCYDVYNTPDWKSFGNRAEAPSAFSRSGLGIWGSIKPDVVEFGGDYLNAPGDPPSIAIPSSEAESLCPKLVRSTLHGGPAVARDMVGTSFAAPKVTHIAAALQATLPDEPCLLYRALIVQSARWPSWSTDLQPMARTALMSRIGYGVPNLERATKNSDYRTTFITSGAHDIAAGSCHIYQVPIPPQLRNASRNVSYLIEVTLSYVAEPRRTRQRHRGYLSTWLDWMSNWRDESIDDFLTRAIKYDQEPTHDGQNIKWFIHTGAQWGQVHDVRRSIGTVQKDWAFLKSHELPEDLCIAVRGHKGWSKDSDNVASYSLAVTIEAVGEEIEIYEPLRAAVLELQDELIEEVPSGEIEIEAESEE